MRTSQFLILLVAVLIFVPFLVCSAEDVTITTYYPSPYGSYNELQLYPHTPATTACDATHGVGTMFYDSSTAELKVCKGAAGWLAFGGGGVSYTYYCYSNGAWGTPSCPGSVTIGTQGPCDAGFTVSKYLGVWGTCCNPAYAVCGGGSSYFIPPGGTCGAGGSYGVGGKAYVCSN